MLSMAIDILFLVAMVLAVLKGLRNGLIIALFSLIGWVLGLFAAIKFSGVAAGYLKGYVSPRWLSIISFVIVFVLVLLLVRLGAGLIEKVVELTLLGWANKLGGVFFYVFLYAFIISVVIVFAEKVQVLNEETISSSRVYPWIKPLAHFTQLSLLH
jgi:membrane protein required for colicin V production